LFATNYSSDEIGRTFLTKNCEVLTKFCQNFPEYMPNVSEFLIEDERLKVFVEVIEKEEIRRTTVPRCEKTL